MLQSEALAQLKSMLSWQSDPALSSTEVDMLLAGARVQDRNGAPADAYQPWKASNAYTVGATLVPTTRNGHYYRVTASDGQSGPAEPNWPTTSGQTVTADGVTYEEAGLAPWSGAWNLRAAAAEGWRWKAGKVAARFDFSSDVSSFKRDQLHKHCLEMVKQYSPGMVSIPIAAGVTEIYDPLIGNLNGAV